MDRAIPGAHRRLIDSVVMGFTPQFRAEVEDLLGSVVPIRTKAMFGGVGIYSGDMIFAIIAEDKLYLKVDPVNRPMFEQAGMEPFYPYDSPTPMGYWELPQAAWTDPEELKVWVDSAVGAADRAKLKRRKR